MKVILYTITDNILIATHPFGQVSVHMTLDWFVVKPENDSIIPYLHYSGFFLLPVDSYVLKLSRTFKIKVSWVSWVKLSLKLNLKVLYIYIYIFIFFYFFLPAVLYTFSHWSWNDVFWTNVLFLFLICSHGKWETKVYRWDQKRAGWRLYYLYAIAV